MARRALRAPNVPFTSSCQGRGTWVRGFSSGNETRLEMDPRICPRPCEGVGLQCEPNCEDTPDETGAARRFWDGMISSKPNLRMCQKFRLPDDCHHFMSKPHQTTVILVSLSKKLQRALAPCEIQPWGIEETSRGMGQQFPLVTLVLLPAMLRVLHGWNKLGQTLVSLVVGRC